MNTPQTPRRSLARALPGALFIVTALAAASGAATAGTLTDLAFTSNGGNYVNDTIVGNATSPLGFTVTGSVSAPFLNSADSTLTLSPGSYYAWSFLGFAQHVGAGSISGKHNGTAFSAAVIFPTNLGVNSTFFTLVFGDGEAISVSTPTVQADRIRVVADGAGLFPDGTLDAGYGFTYAGAVPEPAGSALMLLGCSVLALIARKRAQPR